VEKTECRGDDQALTGLTLLHPLQSCRPERSEGSWFLLATATIVAQARTKIPRFARDDNALSRMDKDSSRPSAFSSSSLSLLQLFFRNFPCSSSLKACWSCSCVFITIGPYQATGSSSGLPETRRKRIPSSPACTLTSSPRSKRIKRAVVGIDWRSCVQPLHGFGRNGQRTRRVAELSASSENIGESVARRFHRQSLFPARSNRYVEVNRIGSNSIHRAFLSPEASADYSYVSAVVVFISGISRAFTSW
jgi:hypothetical protein